MRKIESSRDSDSPSSRERKSAILGAKNIIPSFLMEFGKLIYSEKELHHFYPHDSGENCQ